MPTTLLISLDLNYMLLLFSFTLIGAADPPCVPILFIFSNTDFFSSPWKPPADVCADYLPDVITIGLCSPVPVVNIIFCGVAEAAYLLARRDLTAASPEDYSESSAVDPGFSLIFFTTLEMFSLPGSD